jgi:hypothetical protein
VSDGYPEVIMRSIKTFAAAALLAVSVSSLASGQEGPRPFRDSWFWGLRAGALTYYGYQAPVTASSVGGRYIAPFAGLDWVITRTNGGLYVSYSQAFLKTQGVIANGPTAADTGFRSVSVSGLRRVDALGMMFPGSFVKWHPYIGLGVSFRILSDVDANGPFTGQKQFDYAQSAVNDNKATLGPAFLIGSQYRTKFATVFGQLMVSSTTREFLLANGRTANGSLELGLRYNVGPSVDRQ